MDNSIVEILRMSERLIATTFAGISLILGYKLFAIGAIEAQKGEIVFFKQLRLRALSLSPGVIFLVFGIWGLHTSITTPISVSTAQGRETFTGSTPHPWAVASIPPGEALKAVNSLEQNSSVFLKTDDGKRVARMVMQLKQELLYQEYPTANDKVREFLDLKREGKAAPDNDPTLKQIEATYNANATQ